MQVGIKRDRRSLWMGIFHCWGNDSGSSVVLSAMVSRAHFGSHERACPRHGSIVGCSACMSRSLVRFSLSHLYADPKGARHASRREEGGTSQSRTGLLRANRCFAEATRFGVTVLPRAIACGGTQIGI